MVTTTIKKVGNSAAVILPKALRSQAGMELGSKVSMESPKPGVIVIRATDRPWTLDALMAGYEGPAPDFIDPGEPCGRELW